MSHVYVLVGVAWQEGDRTRGGSRGGRPHRAEVGVSAFAKMGVGGGEGYGAVWSVAVADLDALYRRDGRHYCAIVK